MADRKFYPVAIRRSDAGPSQRAAETVCSLCGDKGHIIMANGTSYPPEVVKRKFEYVGWSVDARREGHDICPKCIKIEKDKRAAAKVAAREEKTVVEMTSQRVPPREPPREMTRDDRRLIFVRLNEVYESETTGYSAGFTDKRVADELNVPQAWVVTVRDENFGPLRDSGELRDIGEKIDGVCRDRDALKAAIEACQKGLATLNGRIDELMQRQKKIAS